MWCCARPGFETCSTHSSVIVIVMPMDRQKIRHQSEYIIFQILLFVFRCLPQRASVTVAETLAWFVACVVPRKFNRYQVSSENLRRLLGEQVSERELDETIFAMWRHLFLMICEIVQLPRRLRLYNCADILEFRRRDDCVKAMCSGRPVLFLGGHFGNWEIGVNTFGVFGFPTGVVARELDNPYLHDWFRRFRESTGNSLIVKTGAGSELNQIMESGGIASLLCDQDAGRSGVFVDFFGQPASTFKSISLLALHYDALIVVGGAFRLPSEQQSRRNRWTRFCLATEDILDARDFQGADGLKELTQQFTSSLENLIRRAPEQYFWVHRRWKTPPGARKRQKVSAA